MEFEAGGHVAKAAEGQRATFKAEGGAESWWTVEPIQPCSARKLMFGRTDIASLRGGIRRFGICHPRRAWRSVLRDSAVIALAPRPEG